MTKPTSHHYELHILGAPDLRAPDGRRVTSVLSQPSRLSLLAYLALAPAPVTRATVVACFWPDSDEARARNALSQAVFYLRRSLGKDAVSSVEGDRLWVPPEEVWCDARTLFADDDPSDEIVAAAEDDLLAGWNADGSQPLQEWLDTHRRRVRERVAELAAVRGVSSELGSRGPDTRSASAGAPGVEGPMPSPRGPAATTPPSATARGAVRRRPWWIPSLVGGAFVALVSVGVASWLGQPADTQAVTVAPPARLIVLLPQVISTPGAPELDAWTLQGELMARLPQRPGDPRVRRGPPATSLQGLRALLEPIGATGEEVTDLILEVTVTVTQNAARVVSLLNSGPEFSLAGRTTFDQTFQGPDAVLIEVPRAIADSVSAMVEGVIDP